MYKVTQDEKAKNIFSYIFLQEKKICFFNIDDKFKPNKKNYLLVRGMCNKFNFYILPISYELR